MDVVRTEAPHTLSDNNGTSMDVPETLLEFPFLWDLAMNKK